MDSDSYSDDFDDLSSASSASTRPRQEVFKKPFRADGTITVAVLSQGKSCTFDLYADDKLHVLRKCLEEELGKDTVSNGRLLHGSKELKDDSASLRSEGIGHTTVLFLEQADRGKPSASQPASAPAKRAEAHHATAAAVCLVAAAAAAVSRTRVFHRVSALRIQSFRRRVNARKQLETRALYLVAISAGASLLTAHPTPAAPPTATLHIGYTDSETEHQTAAFLRSLYLKCKAGQLPTCDEAEQLCNESALSIARLTALAKLTLEPRNDRPQAERTPSVYLSPAERLAYWDEEQNAARISALTRIVPSRNAPGSAVVVVGSLKGNSDVLFNVLDRAGEAAKSSGALGQDNRVFFVFNGGFVGEDTRGSALCLFALLALALLAPDRVRVLKGALEENGGCLSALATRYGTALTVRLSNVLRALPAVALVDNGAAILPGGVPPAHPDFYPKKSDISGRNCAGGGAENAPKNSGGFQEKGGPRASISLLSASASACVPIALSPALLDAPETLCGLYHGYPEETTFGSLGLGSLSCSREQAAPLRVVRRHAAQEHTSANPAPPAPEQNAAGKVKEATYPLSIPTTTKPHPEGGPHASKRRSASSPTEATSEESDFTTAFAFCQAKTAGKPLFGEAATRAFLDANRVKTLIRSASCWARDGHSTHMGGMVHTVWSCPDGVPGVGGSFAVLTAETGYAVPEFHCFDRALPVSTSSWSVLREAALWTLSGVVSRAGRDPRGEQQNGKGRGASTQQRLTIPRSVWVTRMEEGARAVGIGRVPWRVLWRCLADPGFDPQIAVPARQKHVKEQRRSVEHVSVSIPSAYRWHNKVEANWLATWGADVSSMILPLIDSVRDTLSKEAKQSHRFNHFSPKITEDASAFSPGERHLVADRVAGLARGLPVPAICYALLLYEHAAHDRKLGRTRGKGDRAETISKALLGLWVFFRGEDGSSAVTDSSLGFRLKIHFGDEVAGGVEEAEFVRFALEHCDLRRLFPETSSRRETAAWVALARSLQSSNGFVSVDALTEAVLSVENFLVHAPSTASSLFLDLSRSADSIASCLLNEHVRAETLDDEQDTPNPKPSQNASLVTPRNPRWVVDMSSFIKACALHLTDGEVTSDELGIDGRVKAFDYERALLLWRLLAGGAGGNGVAEASRVLDALDTGVPGQGRSEGVVLGVWREEWRLVSRAPVVNACVTAAVVVATALCCDPASLLLLGKGAARKAPFPLSSPPRAGAGPHRSAEAGHGPDVAPHATGAHAALAAANRIDQKRVVSLRAAEEAAMLSVSTGGGKPAAAPHREPPASPDTHAPHPKTPPPPAPVPQQQQEQHQQQQDQPPQPGPASSPPRGELTLADALSAATATVVVARHRPAKKAAAGAGGKPGEEKEPAGKKRAGPPNAQPRAWVRRKGEERGEDAGFAFGSLRVLPGTGRGTNARARLRFEAAAAAAGGERARLSADLPRTPTEAAALLRLAFTLEAWRVPHDLFRSEMFVPPDGSVRASPIPPGGTSPGARHEAGRVSNLSKQRNVSVSAVRRSILDTLVVLETVFGSLETGLSEAAGHDFLSFLSFLSRASADASLPDHLRLLGGESDKGDAAMLPGDPENLQPPPQVAPGGGFLHGLLCAAAAALKSRRKQVFGAVTPLAAREVRKREDLAGGQPGELPQSTGKAPQPKREQKEDTEAPGSGSRGGLHYEAMHAQDVEAFKAALRDKVSERRTRMELRGMVAIGTPVVLKDGTLGSVMEAVDKGRGKLVVRVKKGKLGGGGYRHVDPSDVTFATDFAKRDLLNELGTVPHQRSSLGIAKKNGEYGLGLGMPATPLHFACLALREDIVDYLVAEGADPGVSCVEEGRGGVTCRQLCAANAVASKKRAKEEERRAAEVTKELTESRKLEALALAEMSIRTTDEREAREERRIARKDETRASARAAGGGGTQAPSKPASAKRRDSGSSSASYSSSSSQPATHRRKPKKKKFFHRETSSSSGLDDSTKLGKTIKVALKADKDPSKGGAKGTAKTANAVEAALQAHGSKADAGDSNTDLTDSSSGGDTDDSSEPPETSENKELLEKSRRLATASEALETEHKAALLQASKHQAAARLYKRLAAKLLAWSQNTTRSRRKAGDPDPGEEAGRPADTGGAKGSGGLVVATVVKDGELCLTEASVKSVCSCLAAGGVPSLNLGNIALGADGGGASRILELLQNAPLVASLNLRNCGLSEEHGLALAAALRSPNCKLQELFLWNNMELRGTASLAILDAARSHAYLHTLDLSATGMTHRECQLARRRVFATSLHLLVDIAPTTPSHTRSSPTRTLLPVHTVKAQIETLKQSYLTHRIPQPPSPTSAQPTAEAQPIPPTKPEDQVNPAAGKVLPPATKRPGSQAKVEKKVVVLREVEIINVSVSSEDASGDENEEKMRYLKQAEQEAYDAKLKEEAKRLAASGG